MAVKVHLYCPRLFWLIDLSLIILILLNKLNCCKSREFNLVGGSDRGSIVGSGDGDNEVVVTLMIVVVVMLVTTMVTITVMLVMTLGGGSCDNIGGVVVVLVIVVVVVISYDDNNNDNDGINDISGISDGDKRLYWWC